MAATTPLDEALRRALGEIRRIEDELREAGDALALRRFGDARHGRSIAAALGHRSVSAADARVVAQLSRMPDSLRLMRRYLGAISTGRR